MENPVIFLTIQSLYVQVSYAYLNLGIKKRKLSVRFGTPSRNKRRCRP
jgi:hypothetical protein